MGIATGCVGMSRSDFERCTPSEFHQIYRQWSERDTRLYREGWEQTRTLIGFILPLYRTKEKASDILPFPWDEENKNATTKGSSSPAAFRNILKKRSAKDNGASLVGPDNVPDKVVSTDTGNNKSNRDNSAENRGCTK